MESSSLVEEVRLCEGCRSLQLDTHLFPQGNEDYSDPRSITLCPDQCSLCSLIDRRLCKPGSAGGVSVSGSVPKVMKTYGLNAGQRKTGSERIRRFEVTLASSPRVTLVRFWPCLYPVPSLRDFCDINQSPAVPFPTGRLIESFADVRLFKRWMQLCLIQHGDVCARPSWIPSGDDFPASFRLIDLQADCIVDSIVKPSYFALSYVWGPSEGDLRATSENIDNLKMPHSLTQEALPQTIRDIMKLVSDLGGKYLWVDRLCILQDDEADKSLQIPQMDTIYSLAELTVIAASGSGAHDGVAGLSNPRKLDQDICRVSSRMALMTFPTENPFPSCSYSRRGWTFQERLLSRRTLMFTEGQVFWSCCCTDWTERLSLEPCRSELEANPWVIPRIHLGNCERVPVEYYRDFSLQQYNELPRFYALKEFSDESDALDAITGLLHRISRVTGDEFYWGHLLSGMFGQSLSWRKTRLDLERRTAMCPFRGTGTSYSVRFPSWSWLGWKASIKFVIDLNLITVPNALLVPEIDFFHLDVDGRIKRLVPLVTGTERGVVDRSALLYNDASGSWKGEANLTVNNFSEHRPFRDSGQLLFWTSHAELSIRAEERVRLGCVRIRITSTLGQTVGHIDELTLACAHGSAWPFIKYDESVLQSFIVK
jgi:hypothetical protein